MEKIKRIWIPVVVVVFMAGGFLFWMIHREDADALKIEVEDVPCGLEWGMSEEEVTHILAQTKGYTRDEEHPLTVYEVDGYQGIDGVDGTVTFSFDESSKLVNVTFRFKVEESQGGKMSPDMVNKLRKGLDKAYEKYSSETYTVTSDLYFDKYYVGETSVVTVASPSEGDVFLTFADKAQANVLEKIEELRK